MTTRVDMYVAGWVAGGGAGQGQRAAHGGQEGGHREGVPAREEVPTALPTAAARVHVPGGRHQPGLRHVRRRAHQLPQVRGQLTAATWGWGCWRV